MALSPRFSGHRPGKPGGHTIELYLDFTCPWSRIMIEKLAKGVFPTLEEHSSGISFIFRHQVQLWHPSSTMIHEPALVVERVDPTKFWDYSLALFERQTSYFDSCTATETRLEIYKGLAMLAEEIVFVKAEDVLRHLNLTLVETGSFEGRNIGNAVTDDLKYFIRLGRANGVHFSPTVLFNRIHDPSIQSSYSAEQWHGYLKKTLH